MDERTLKNIMTEKGLSVAEGTPEQKLRHLEQTIRLVLPPKNISDRTCFRNVIKWLYGKIEADTFNEYEIFRRIIDYLLESSGPSVKNPHALFMSILKKELNYPR
jgi:hypothetical protein